MSPSNGSIAPVCPVSRSQTVYNQPPAQQTIVPAVDLPSAIVALNQIANILQTPTPNNLVPITGNGGAPASGVGGLKTPNPGWEEQERNYEPIDLFNPNDHDYSVTLNRISFISFQERRTKVTLVWMLGAGSGP